MRLVEQHIIKKGDPRFNKIDEMAFASKNLWNLANYCVRQSFIFQGTLSQQCGTLLPAQGNRCLQSVTSQSQQSSPRAVRQSLDRLF